MARFLLLLFLPVILCAQQTDTLLWRARKITNEQSPLELRNGFTCAVQDQDGYMWFGSNNGVIRFDGHHYKSLKHSDADTNSLGGQMVYALQKDQNGNLWAGGYGWLTRIHPRTFTTTTWRTSPDGLPQGVIKHFVCDSREANWLWISVNGNHAALCRLWIKENRFEYIKLPNPDRDSPKLTPRVLHLEQDGNGLLYQGRISSMVVFNPAANRYSISYYSDPFLHFTYLLPEKSGCHSYHSFTHYHIAEDATTTSASLSGKQGVKYGDALRAQGGHLLLSTSDGRLMWCDTSRMQLREVQVADMQAGSLQGMFVDRDDDLWLSASDGIWLCARSYNLYHPIYPLNIALRKLGAKDELHDYGYLSGQSRLLASTQGKEKVLMSYHLRSQHLHVWSKPEFSNNIVPPQSFVESAFDSAIYFLQHDTLWRLSDDGRFAHEQLPMPDSFLQRTKLKQPFSLFIDANSALWICDFWNGVMRKDLSTGAYKYFSYPSQFPVTNNIHCVGQTSDGRLWFRSHHGLCWFDGSRFQKVQCRVKGTVLDSTRARFDDAVVDEDGTLWLSSKNTGLYHYFPALDSFYLLGENDGLLPTEITTLKRDKEGNLWMRAANQLLVYNPKTKHCRTTDFGYFYDFGERSGDFVLANDWLVANSGNMLFRASLKEITKLMEPCALSITSVQVYDKELELTTAPNLTEEIQLNYRQNFLRIEFSALNYVHSHQLHYKYRMEGLNKEWMDTRGLTEVSFGNLDPGTYVFHLGVSTPDGTFWGRSKPLRIVITPPFWQTWWFRTGILLLFGFLVYAVVRFQFSRRMRQQRHEFEKREQVLKERARIAAELHDDMGSGLTKISLLTQVVQKVPEGQREQMLQKIQTASSTLVNHMNDIVWALNTQNDSLANLVAYTRVFATDLLDSTTVQLKYVTPEKINDYPLSGELRKNIFLIVKEALHNTLKYAGASEVQVRWVQHEAETSVTISDNGKGFEGAGRAFGNGMKNMQRRADEMDAELQVVSAENKGTTVSLTWQMPGISHPKV